ncbi:MAG TPA: asparagine synthase (glutamine-hydrolyzing), partial [Gemmatimonadales bacterium]|nr:asparagine synthase (glutamine-hydrolyzing) [Gemmatimonadales bacterium]
MCGITGFWTPSGLDRDSSEQLRRMTDALRHRGPDDAGAWLDPSAGVALGHRRLSIIDLSPEGHQPMVSASGRYVIVYNGEIYNFRGLRAEEERAGVRFRGHSDTEVLLAAIERRGVEAAVCSAAGMFAFALWDRESRRLHLVRDRIGEKPLYYGWVGGTLLFGSELKSLRAHRSWRADIDRDALALFMRFAYVPAPRSIYSGMAKVPQASIVTVAAEGTVETNEYWRLADVIRRGRETPLDGSEEEVVSTVERRLSETIGEQMVSDVPLGAFLSGGIDSSTIVALMQGQSSRPVRTFTIGFHEAGYNEAESAKAV